MQYLAQTIHQQTQDVDTSVGVFSGLIITKSLSGLYAR